MKNSNKKAGNWGALKNKPQNQIYFKDGGKVKVTAGGEKHVIYKKTTKRGEGKVGNIMVNHPTKDKGIWDTIDLTKKSGAKTIKQGIASTKKWHKENPYNDMKKQVTKKQMGGPSQKTKTVNKNGSYRTVEKTKSTPSSFKQSSKTTRTGYGILKGAPKYKNILPAPVTPTEPSSDSKYMKKGGSVKKYQTGGKVTPPTGKNALKTGVYKGGKKFTPADAKSMQQDWNKKERAATNPKNKPAGSPMRKLQNGGTADSTKYFYDKSTQDILNANKVIQKKGSSSKEYGKAYDTQKKSLEDLARQSKKGKAGYDKNGYPIKKK